ncbi:MAG: GGDEF domain-containing protein, partial [Verrucomicrobiota bacterium]
TGVMRADKLGYAYQKVLSRYRKEGQAVSFLVLDIDHLDNYNQHYGREGGDAVLKGMGPFLEKNVRLSDIIGRPEEDEFTISMVATLEQARGVANRLVTESQRTSFRAGEAELKVTFGIGLAGHPEHGSLAHDLVESARVAMKSAKCEGKGRVKVFDPDKMVGESRQSAFDKF